MHTYKSGPVVLVIVMLLDADVMHLRTNLYTSEPMFVPTFLMFHPIRITNLT